MSATTPQGRQGLLALLRRHVLLGVAAVLLIASVGCLVAAQVARGVDNVPNDALVDAAASNDVKAEVGTALVRVLSYDYSDPQPTKDAADELLAGKARSQYDTLFQTLQAKAVDQKLVLSASVQVAAVQKLAGRSARVMVFLDQASQRADEQESVVSAAQLVVDARREGSTWRITGLRPL